MSRVLIVDDSITVRKAVAERLQACGIEVVGEASCGNEALALTHRLRPDVILMDVVMPGIDGLAATRLIMEEVPTPIVILSAYSDSDEVFKTYDALTAGALEVCVKPMTSHPSGEEAWRDIVRTVQAASDVKTFKLRPDYNLRQDCPRESAEGCIIEANGQASKIVVIGASTGGPAAVRWILYNLPPDYPLPILIAIHCSGKLPISIAGWFARQSQLDVRDARDGEQVQDLSSTAIVAPSGKNLRVCDGQVMLSEGGNSWSGTSSVDELFTSTADCYGPGTIGVLLTGMGTDGAQGLKRIRDCGGCTIAQDEATSVIFGMPAAAIKLGAADHVAPLHQIPQMLRQLAELHCEPYECKGGHL